MMADGDMLTSILEFIRLVLALATIFTKSA